jgi:hypothetical protein
MQAVEDLRRMPWTTEVAKGVLAESIVTLQNFLDDYGVYSWPEIGSRRPSRGEVIAKRREASVVLNGKDLVEMAKMACELEVHPTVLATTCNANDDTLTCELGIMDRTCMVLCSSWW